MPVGMPSHTATARLLRGGFGNQNAEGAVFTISNFAFAESTNDDLKR
jgi:hypothetical protein